MDLIRSHGIFDRIHSTSLIRLRIRYLSFISSWPEANFLMMILPLRALWTVENGSDLALPTKHSQVALQVGITPKKKHFNQTVDSDFSSCLGSLSFCWKFGWEHLSFLEDLGLPVWAVERVWVSSNQPTCSKMTGGDSLVGTAGSVSVSWALNFNEFADLESEVICILLYLNYTSVQWILCVLKFLLECWMS